LDHKTPENIAQTVANIMEQIGAVDVMDITTATRRIDDPLVLAVPAGQTVQDFTDRLRQVQQILKPYQRKGTAKLTTVRSLIDWANRFKGENSIIYAQNDAANLSLTCVADYHGAGAAIIDNLNGDPSARHCHHRATYAFPLSKQWQAWTAISGAAQSGVEMGVFLENNILDVIDPHLQLTSPGIAGAEATEADHRLIDIARRLEGSYGTGAQLLGMAKSFTVNEAADYTVAHNSTTGEQTIQIKSEHVDGTGQPIKVPKLFLIAIPVFEGGPAYRLPVRFQYRKAGATVKFVLTLHDPKHAKDHAFDEAAQTVQADTSLPLLMGQPEA
jgi:uncharacterized protein YfdQ (DUF2303 family)